MSSNSLAGRFRCSRTKCPAGVRLTGRWRVPPFSDELLTTNLRWVEGAVKWGERGASAALAAGTIKAVPKAFISYSWDDDAHRDWVRDFAARLRQDGVESVLDRWHVVPGDQLPAFMERSVRESDYVLIICTPRYKARSDAREGGVGYEGDIMTGEVMNTQNQRKFIPILRRGEWLQAAPTWLQAKYRLDLRDGADAERQYQDLLTTILGTREQPPPVAAPGSRSAVPAVGGAPQNAGSGTGFESIRIEGLLVDEIGTPRGDRTPGSALYDVPFKLSRRPTHEWVDLFIEAWNRPSSFTSMHRPGIASIRGDRILLDGTTVDEVAQYHRDTLVQAVQRANSQYAELVRRREAAEARERERLEQHRKSVANAAKKVKFD